MLRRAGFVCGYAGGILALICALLMLYTVPAGIVDSVVQQIGSETFVWRVKADDSVEKANVVVGGCVPGKVMLKDGVKAGERIVTEGVGKLQAGAKIAAGRADAAPAGAAK